MPGINSQAKILIVEDEAIIARDIANQLTSYGFNVIGMAARALEAFQAIEREQPDIIMMDISIQGETDGIEAAEVIRNRYALPVVFLTAHTDPATLERASLTEPFGFIVKPLGNTNMRPLIMMALSKHRVERELSNSRKMLSTILQGLPDAVIVTDPQGEILFLNQEAEQLTGWAQEEAAGRRINEVAPIEAEDGRLVSLLLLREALAGKEKIRVPNSSALLRRDGRAVEVSGHLAATRGNRQQAAGVLVTLHDATAQRNEELRLRQEHQMLVVGELAGGVAREFYAISNLIEESAYLQAEGAKSAELELIRKASQLGKDMALQLMDLQEARGQSHAVNVSHYLLGSRPLWERFCGAGVDVDVFASPNVGYMLSTGNYFEQLLTHLCLNAKHFVDGRGQIRITASGHDEPVTPSRSRSYVRIDILAARSNGGGATESMAFGGELPHVNLSIIRAMAIASEGFSRVTEGGDNRSLVQVFLPRFASREIAVAATREYSRVVLAIGLPDELLEAVRRTTGDGGAVLEAANVEEATLVSELFAGDIDLIVASTSAAARARSTREFERIQARRPLAGFLQFGRAGGWPEVNELNPDEVEGQVASFFQGRALQKGAARA